MTTLLGLISDVHGDLSSLQIALDFLQERGVDTILCAGDLVERGPDGDGVVQLIREREIPCVLGNHDEWAPDAQQWLRENADLDQDQILTEETLAYLSTLPLTRRFTWEDRWVLLAHGSPKSNMDTLYPHSPSRKFKIIARESYASKIPGRAVL